ncbi:MAG TPA: ABC-2 family transporter protein [Desulfobacteria bacterium]|nr:ABC-2 family transporter protein [Desulfobacteria bacterium]
MLKSLGAPGMGRALINRLILYSELVRMEFKNNLAYRTTYFTGILNYSIQIGAYFYLWDAIYAGGKVIGGLNREEMITYVIVAWVVRSFYFSNLDRRVAVEIRDGKIALELIRPYSYQMVKYARAFGEAIFRMIFFAFPAGLIIFALHPFSLPPDRMSAILFLVAAIGSFVINAQISMLVGFVVFFTKSTNGIYKAKRVVMDLFSGLLIPISFYPQWARDIIKLFPFQAVSYLPTMIYLGKNTHTEAFLVLGLQVLWITVLGIISTLVWKFAVKHVVIQGG